MKKDNQLLIMTHLSQLLSLATGFLGFLVPLVIWIIKKDEIEKMDMHGKAILNFQLSMIIYAVICVPLIFLFGLGVIGLIIIGILVLIFPIINALKVDKNEAPHYPFSIVFLK